MHINFLDVEQVKAFNKWEMEARKQESIILNLSLLESAVLAPQATYDGEYLYNDIYKMASVYLFHISQNHGFQDGNKRTAVISAIAFLNLNKIDFIADEDKLFEIALNVAKSLIGKEEVADFIEKNSVISPFLY